MGISPEHLTRWVIQPALEPLGLWSEAANQLLLGTAAVESHMGHYLHQIRGPAVGIFQMEPNTFADHWRRLIGLAGDFSLPKHLEQHSILASRIMGLTGIDANPEPERMSWDLRFAAIMARVHYLRVPAALPAAGDWPAMAVYWKRYYNTINGKGTETRFLNAAREFGLS